MCVRQPTRMPLNFITGWRGWDFNIVLHPLVKSDVKRPAILRDFFAHVEDDFNDVPEVDISRWLSNFIDTDAGLMP
ncbi:MAG TPA: hypothetical protein HA304_00395 [Methanosarcinales archaeon]|nr:hypothetical protein [Methanosarcinales archaeon]